MYVYIYIYIDRERVLGNGYHIQGPITSGPGRWATIICVSVDTSSEQCKGNVSLLVGTRVGADILRTHDVWLK